MKLATPMTSLWITILTPAWLFGSACIGGTIYSLVILFIRLALYLFRKKHKAESSSSSDPVLSYLLFNLFVVAQLGFFIGTVLLANIFQGNHPPEAADTAEGPMVSVVVGFTLLVLVGCVVCTFGTHLTLRQYIISQMFEAYMSELDEMSAAGMQPASAPGTAEIKPGKIKVKYPLFLKKGKGGNMFQRAEREDVKAPKESNNSESNALELVAAKPSKADIRKRIVEQRGHEIMSVQVRPQKAEFFSTRNQVPDEATPESNTQTAGEKKFSLKNKKPMKKFETDRVVITEKGSHAVKDQFVYVDKIDKASNGKRQKFVMTEKQKALDVVTQRSSARDGPAQPAEPENEEDNLCQICFTEPPTAVVLDCGHGGSCLNCTIDAMKKNNQCLFCRAKVVLIIEINNTQDTKGLYKVVNSYYVSDEMA